MSDGLEPYDDIDLPRDIGDGETDEQAWPPERFSAEPISAGTRHGRRVANPGDPPTRRPRYGPYGPQPAPINSGAPGRMAIVQGQVAIVGIIVAAQLLVVTIALLELLQDITDRLWWLAGISLVGFILALVITLWPRSRVKGF
jgi:hypothetical protein